MPTTRSRSSSASARTVYDELRRQIVDGELRPGSALVEAAVAKALSVSRTPVREAFTQLVYEGLIERHDRAMRVRVLRPEDVIALYEVRIALERAAARAAAERRTDLDAGALQHIVDQMQTLPDERVDDRAPLSHQFHFALWRASHNPALIEVLETVQVRVTSLSSTTLHYPERWDTFRREAADLAAAVRSRDVEEAGRVAEIQMTNARDFRVRLYSSGTDF